MTASTQAKPLPTAPARPVSLYENNQGDLYLLRDDLAFPVPSDWKTRLTGHACPFRADAEPWANGQAVAEPNDAARQLRLTLQNQGGTYRHVATLRDGKVDIHRGHMRPETRAYLGLPPTPTPTPAPTPTPTPKPAGMTPDPFDAIPRTLRPLPDTEIRLGPDLILCLFRDSEHPNCWYLLAHDAAGNYLSAWAKGVGAHIPDAVWALAADAIGRRHFIAKHGRR